MDQKPLLALLDVEVSAARTYGWARPRLATTCAWQELEAARRAHEQRAQRLREVLGAVGVEPAAACWRSVVALLDGCDGCGEIAAIEALAAEEARALGRYREALSALEDDPEVALVLRELCPQQEQTHARLFQLSTLIS